MISTVSFDMILTLNVTTSESTQRRNPTNVASWMKQWLMIQELCVGQYNISKILEKQSTFRPASGKDKQLDCVLIDKRSRRYCTDAEANDMTHLGSDYRSVTAHFRFPCVEKTGGD